MKSNLSKLCKTLLLGAAFAVVGCTDYSEDIRKVNDDLTASVSSLEKTIKDLETKLASEYALKKDVDQFKSDLEGQINSKIADVNKTIADLDKAVKQNASDIQTAVANANKAIADANAAILQLQSNKADKTEVDNMKKDLQGKIDALQSSLDALSGRVGTAEGDIAKLKSDLASVDVRLTQLNTTVDGINTRVASLESSVSKNTEDIESLLADCKDLKERMSSAESGISDNKAAIEKEVEARKLAIEQLEATVDGRYEEYLGHVAAYEAKVAELEAADMKFTAAIDTLKNDIKKHNDAIEALKAEDERLAGLVEDLDAVVKALDTKVDSLKGDVAKISEAVEAAEAKIDAIGLRVDAVEAKLEAIDALVKNFKDAIAALADRIQSIVFVPEYVDNMATSTRYAINGKAIGENQVVTASFKVTPEYLIPDIADGKYDVQVLAVPVKTRAAAAEQAAEAVVCELNTKSNLLDVTATFPLADLDQFAISLYIADKAAAADEPETVAEEGEEGEGDETEVPASPLTPATAKTIKNYKSSGYIQVCVTDVELKKNYGLYNFDEEKKYEDRAESIQWVTEPDSSIVDFHAGYEIALELDGKWYALDAAAGILNVDVAEITPEFEKTVTQYILADTDGDPAEKETADCDYIAVADTGVVAQLAQVIEAVNAKDAVKHYAEIASSWYFGEDAAKVSVVETKDTYEIIKAQIEIEIPAVEVAWDYATALKLSDYVAAEYENDGAEKTPAEPATKANEKPINSTIAKALGNVEIKDCPLTVAEILAAAAPTTTVTLNGTAVATDAPTFTMTKVEADSDAEDADAAEAAAAKLVNIAIEKYAFAQGEKNVYAFSTVYNVKEQVAEVTVKFTLTLGEMPEDQEVEITKENVDFNPDVTTIDLKDIDVIDPVFEAVGSYFADDKAVFTKHFSENKVDAEAEGTRTDAKGTENLDADQLKETFLQPIAASINEDVEKACIQLSTAEGAVTAFDNAFTFTTTYTTWYGVTYTYVANVNLVKPDLKLNYNPTWVNNATVELKGQVIPEDDTDADNVIPAHYSYDLGMFSNYFYVTGITEDTNTEDGKLTVDLVKVTVDNEAAGYKNSADMSVSKESVAVDAKGLLEESNIEWKSTYSARDIEFKAVLKYGGVELDSKNITLTIADPIVNFVAGDIVVEREANVASTAYLWANTVLNVVESPTVNIIDQDAKNAADAVDPNNLHGIKLSYSDEIAVQVVEPGAEWDENAETVVNQKVSVANGVVTIAPEAATTMYKDVLVKCTGTIEHDYNYLTVEGKDEHSTFVVYVRITQKQAK